MYARHRASQPRGRTVLKKSGVYTIHDGPTVDQVNSADIAYLGGHIYEVTDAEAASLIAAGFSIILGYPGHLLTEDGDFLTTEAGDRLMSEYI